MANDTFKPTINVSQEDEKKKLETLALFAGVFNTDNGKKVLEYLDTYTHKNFPNYENVNATYSKIGEQSLLQHIRDILINAKKKGVL